MNSGEEDLEDRLPITSSRTSKWWRSAFHNVTSIIGAGVLTLPYAMSQLGWGPGFAVLVISWVITFYTFWELVQMHEISPSKRFNRYHELGQYAFGEKLGLWIVVPQQLLNQVGVDIVYLISGAKSLKYFICWLWPRSKNIRQTYFVMIFASVNFMLAQLPNMNAISSLSLVAAMMSIGYSTVAWGASIDIGKKGDVEYGYKSQKTRDTILNFFNALGHVAFAYNGHNVALEIQATFISTPEKPSKKPMWKGVVTTYIIIAMCYFPVALIGYWTFGNSVDKNILSSINQLQWPAALANLMVAVHFIGSYQLYAMPVFDMIETLMVKKLDFYPSNTLRLITRTYYVAFTMFMAITFPFFSDFLGFIGGFAYAPATFFLPCIMWLATYKPKKFSLSWITNWICIMVGVMLMIVAPIGAVWQMYDETTAKNS